MKCPTKSSPKTFQWRQEETDYQFSKHSWQYNGHALFNSRSAYTLSWTLLRQLMRSRDDLLKKLTRALIQLKDKSLLKNKAFVNGKWVTANLGKTFEVNGR